MSEELESITHRGDGAAELRRGLMRRRRATRLAIAGTLLATSIASLWSCDAFTPRDPEPPNEVQPIIILSRVDSVYRTLQLGISSKFINTYINAFDPSAYRFHPDPEDSLILLGQGIDPFDGNWTRPIEEQVHSSIFGSYEELELIFTGPAQDSGEVALDVVFFRKPYRLVATGRDPQGNFDGIAEWTMERKSGEWRIIHWQDVRVDTSWGFLKGLNR